MVKVVGINRSYENGPFNVAIIKITIADLYPAESNEIPMDDKDRVTMICIEMEVKNISSEILAFHPNQGSIVVAQEQKKADFSLSGEIGGNFIGQENKDGGVVFILDTPPAKIDKIQYIVGRPMRTDGSTPVGEDLVMEFEIR